jgi:TolA-binding protein
VSDVDRRLEELSVPVRQAIEQEEARALDLRAQLKEVEENVKRYERVLKSMQPVEPPKPKRQKDNYISEESLARVREYFGANEQAIVSEVMAALKLSEPTVRKAVTVLRERGEVRLAGTGANKAMLFKAVTTNG